MDHSQTDTKIDISDTGNANTNKRAAQWVQYTFWGFVGLALLLVAALSALASTHKPNTQSSTVRSQGASVLLSVSPQVQYKAPDNTQFEPVEKQIQISEGGEVRTSETGQAVLLYPNGTITALKANTHIAIERLRNGGDNSRLQLLAGGVWSRIEETLTGSDDYSIASEDVVTSVRGTEFAFDATGQQLALDVVSDEVALANIRSAGGTTTASTTLLSGERLQIPLNGESTELAETDITALTERQLARLIRRHDQLTNRLNSGDLQSLVAQARGRVNPDDDAFTSTRSPLESLGESLSSLLVQDAEQRARHYLLRAEERIAEAQQLAAADNEGAVNEAVGEYQKMIGQASRAAKQSGNSDLIQEVVESTRDHQSIFDTLAQVAPDTARSAVKWSQSIAEGAHVEALRSLTETDPNQAYREAISSMRANLRSAQSESVIADDRGMQNKLREYDRIMQLANNASDQQVSRQAQYADQLRKSLSVVETVDGIGAESLSPGSARVTEEARARTIRSQQAAIASVAKRNPQKAVKIYERTSDMYLDRLERRTRGTTTENEEAVADLAEAYTEYASFGEEMSRIATSLGPDGTSTVRDLVRQATDRHTEVLQQVKDRVPQQAQSAIDKAINASENIQRPATPQQAIRPDEFAKQKQKQRPQNDLDTPAAEQFNRRPASQGPGAGPQSGEAGPVNQRPDQTPGPPNNQPSEAGPTEKRPSDTGPSGQQSGSQAQPNNTTDNQPADPDSAGEADVSDQQQPSSEPTTGSQDTGTQSGSIPNNDSTPDGGSQSPDNTSPTESDTGGQNEAGAYNQVPGTSAVSEPSLTSMDMNSIGRLAATGVIGLFAFIQ